MTRNELKDIIKECILEEGFITENASNIIYIDMDTDIEIYGKILDRKIIYKDKFRNKNQLSSEATNKIKREVIKQVSKAIVNEKEIISQIYYKMKNEINKENWKDVYLDEFEVVETNGKYTTNDEFDIWAYTSKEQFSCKIKDGKILANNIEFLS